MKGKRDSMTEYSILLSTHLGKIRDNDDDEEEEMTEMMRKDDDDNEVAGKEEGEDDDDNVLKSLLAIASMSTTVYQDKLVNNELPTISLNQNKNDEEEEILLLLLSKLVDKIHYFHSTIVTLTKELDEQTIQNRQLRIDLNKNHTRTIQYQKCIEKLCTKNQKLKKRQLKLLERQGLLKLTNQVQQDELRSLRRKNQNLDLLQLSESMSSKGEKRSVDRSIHSFLSTSRSSSSSSSSSSTTTATTTTSKSNDDVSLEASNNMIDIDDDDLTKVLPPTITKDGVATIKFNRRRSFSWPPPERYSATASSLVSSSSPPQTVSPPTDGKTEGTTDTDLRQSLGNFFTSINNFAQQNSINNINHNHHSNSPLSSSTSMSSPLNEAMKEDDDRRMANKNGRRSIITNEQQETRESVDSYGYEIRDQSLVLKKEEIRTTSSNDTSGSNNTFSSSHANKKVGRRIISTSNGTNMAVGDSNSSSRNRVSSDNHKRTAAKSQPKKVHTSGSGWSPSPSLSPVQPFSIDTLTSLWNK